jgi:hypothetical protein
MSVRTIPGQVRPFGHRLGLALSKPNATPTSQDSENVTGNSDDLVQAAPKPEAETVSG